MLPAVILVGGQGTRLRPLTDRTRKDMLPLVDRPLLAYTFEHLARYDIPDKDAGRDRLSSTGDWTVPLQGPKADSPSLPEEYSCMFCHGGSPTVDEFTDHRDDESFRSVASPEKIREFCGHCHFDAEYMRRYRPSPQIDPLVEYLAGRHG